MSLARVALVLAVFGKGISALMIAGLFTALITDAILLQGVRKLGKGISVRGSAACAKATISYGLRAYPGNVLSYLHLRVDLLLLNAYLDPASVGFYAVAVALVDQLGLVAKSASTALLPRVAAQTTLREEDRRDLTPLVSRTVLLLTACAGAVMYVVAPFLVRLLYSSVYLPVVEPLRILILSVVLLAGARVLGNDIAGRGRPMLNTYTTGAALVVNVVLNIFLIPNWGIRGAAWASTSTYGLLLVLRALVYCRLSGQSLVSVLIPRPSDWRHYRRILIRVLERLRSRRSGGGPPVADAG